MISPAPVAALSLVLASEAVAPSADQTCTLAPERSAIVMNQTGFERFGPKFAVLRTETEAAQIWRLLDTEGALVETGQTRPAGFDASAGESVHHIDFSEATPVGDGFRIEACGAQSRAFPIGSPSYAGLAEDSLRYFYRNRLGIDLKPEFAGTPWARAGGFMTSRATCFSGEDLTGTTWPGCGYTLDTSGGWADAGDYGQYVVNGGVSVWTLHYVFERFQSRGELEGLDWDGARVALPNSRDGISEILLEARWQLEFMLGLQVPDGARVWVDTAPASDDRSNPTEIDGSGLVHHKLHERAWLPLPLLPENANEPRHLHPPSTAATLNLAAVAAQCSRVWRELDPDFADRCLAGSERAFEAALRHPALYARNLFDGGGAYGDINVTDEFYWAATELYLATGEAHYRELADQYRAGMSHWRPIFWASMELLAELSAQLHPDKEATHDHAVRVILDTAQDYQAQMEDTGYRYPLPPSDITWGSNAGVLNRGLILAAAHDVDPEQGFRDGVVNAMDYLLGRNPLDQSYVAGYGARAMRHPHHRFWAEGADPDFPPAPPGALSGGPNFQIMTDSIARDMQGQCAPQTCWVDHVDAFTMNEVAINWNAPLFAIAAYLEATQERQD